MSQHYTLATVEASEWCNKCRKATPHHVAARRAQYCIPCFDRSVALAAADEASAPLPFPGLPAQLVLFGGRV
jgi:hypothetical protein